MIFNNDLYIAKVTVEEYGAENGGRRFYNLKTIKIEPADGRLEKISTSPMSDTDSTISISDLHVLVKVYDKDFKSQPSSKVVNADGTPKVVCLTKHWQKNQTEMCQCTILTKTKPCNSQALSVCQFPGGFKNIDGYVHSIRDSGSPVNMKIENVTKINRHNAREQSKKGSIYLGLLRDGENLYIGRAITNDSNVLEDVEALYALSNKKESVAHNRLDSGDNLRLDTDSKISIADFLNIVKDKYADVLPKYVLDSLNMERPNSSVSDSVRYSKELMTAEEKKKVREAERAAYLERQLVSNRTARRKSKSRFSDSKSRSSEENSVRYARRIDSSGKRTAHKV